MLSSRGRVGFLIEPDSIHNARRSTDRTRCGGRCGKDDVGKEEKNLDAAAVMMMMTVARL